MLICVDLDGTLLDTVPANAASYRAALEELGFCKNCFDLGCVTCALLIGTLFGSPLLGIGLGTLLSMLGVGRVMAIWNRMVKQKLLKLAGLNP